MAFDPTGAVPVQPTQPSSFDPAGATPVGKPKITQPKLNPVDYDTGLNFVDRLALSQADNDEERMAYLRPVYGPKNVMKEEDGTITVNIKGKKIAANGGGFMSGLAADVLGNTPTLAGAAYGGTEGFLLGTPGGPWGMALGALGGAALGAATGKSIQEVTKQFIGGTYRKDMKQYGDVMLDTMKGGVEGEAGGRILGKVVGKIVHGGLPSFLTQMNKEDVQLNERMLAGGARPNAQASMPGMKRIQFMETLARKTVGAVKSQDEANAKYIQNRMARMLYQSGMPQPEIEATLKAMSDNSAMIPTADVGNDVRKAIQAHQNMLEKNIEQRGQQVDNLISTRVNKVDKLMKSKDPEDLGINASEAIQSARRDLGNSVDKMVQKADDLAGGKPLVPIKLLTEEATRIAGMNFQSQAPAMAKEAAGMLERKLAPADKLLKELGIEPPRPDDHGMVTFTDAHRMMRQLIEKSGSGPVKNVLQQDISDMAEALSLSIKMAAKNPAAKPAVQSLNKAFSLYDKGIKKFEDSTVKWLYNLTEKGIMPDPEVVASKILAHGSAERIATVKKLIGAENWKKVVGADYRNLMAGARDQFGNIDGVKLLAQLNARGATLNTVYGKTAEELRELSRLMAVRDGRLPVDELSPSNAKLTLEHLKQEEKVHEQFMKENALSDLTNPKKNPEDVYEWLARPNNYKELGKAVKLLGPGHPALEGVRRAALKNVLTNVKMNIAETGRASDSLTNAIKKYSPEQQQLLFPGGLADDIKLLGKETDRLMADLTDSSKASFAAGAVLATPFFARVPVQAGIAAYQIILSQPKMIKYLALGLRSKNTYVRQNTKGLLRTMIRYGYLPTGQAEEPEHEDKNGRSPSYETDAK
jgi:hypothetical protein